MDKAGKAYWDQAWAGAQLPLPVDTTKTNIDNIPRRRLAEFFKLALQKYHGPEVKLLEIGCAKSPWLPYFAKEYGYSVSGIDYSEIGCELARHILEKNNIKGDIFCVDLFSPPSNLREQYDIEISFGVAEHFEDTENCVAHMSKFVKPGGILITLIPNMTGLIGLVQRILSKEIFDAHKPLDLQQLKAAHVASGLEIIKCEYVMSTNFGTCNFPATDQNKIVRFIKKAGFGVLVRISKIIWIFENKFVRIPPSRIASPYVICVARKKAE